ncbi:MAG TPA: PaaI family thioesterase [Kineosporiaceae bacterium]
MTVSDRTGSADPTVVTGFPVSTDSSVVSSPELARLVGATRDLQDRVLGTLAPPDTLMEVVELLQQASARLDPFRMTGSEPPSWSDLERTAATRSLAPELTSVVLTESTLRGEVTFATRYLGGNGAVHGGALPLFFDEVLGRLANVGRAMARTASLTVDFRRVTPVARPLSVVATVDRVDGRKRYLHAALYDGDAVTAEASALFVELRPGQA